MIIMPFGFCDAQTLVWSDEFDYTGLPDANKWGNEVGYIRNNELQYYTDRDIDNQVVRNGFLEITGLEESFGGYNYTSASINTKNAFSFTYGTIEARMKLPEGQGLWPAFWMLGTNIDQVGWPACGEFDVMEHINTHDYITGTAHWDNSANAHQQDQGYYTVDVTQWHTYSIVWDENNITWYVDGNQYHQMNISDSLNGTEELHKPQYILLNLAIGGSWPGAPDASTVFPATMYVDYVRVYQRDNASEILDTLQFEDMNYDASTVWDVPTGFADFVGLSFNDEGVFASQTIDFPTSGSYEIEVKGFVNYNAENSLILEIDGAKFDTISFPESSVNWWSDPMTYDDVTPAIVSFKSIEIENDLTKDCKFILGAGNGDIVLDWALVKKKTNENPTAINHTISEPAPCIYPNPSENGIINIDCDNLDYKSVSIFNIRGVKVPFELKNFDSSTRLIIREKGLHFVSFNYNGKIHAQKVFIQNR
jgi:beta-glucanase (GH16 family)